MKRFFALLVVLSMLIAITACGESKEQTETKAPGASENVIEKDLPEGVYEELGEGTAYVSTAGGTSENGNVPVIYAEPDIIVMQIGLNAWDFNGNALSFVYIDGMLIDKMQLADTQTSLNLQQNQLTDGLHKVEVVQYENDDPSAAMITYKAMQYEVKPA